MGGGLLPTTAIYAVTYKRLHMKGVRKTCSSGGNNILSVRMLFVDWQACLEISPL